MKPHCVLQTILMSLYQAYASGLRNETIAPKLNLVINKEILEFVDLNNIKSFWDTVSKIGNTDQDISNV
jgi:predicted alternative tryptophan synthase beta-subunit